MRLAQQFACYAAVAIGNTALYLTSAKLAAQMQEAMASQAVIEQAKGALMALNRCDADEAFAKLVTASQHSHKKLRDVARELVQRATSSAN
ncbi:MAG: ANTAR domain-containing protein [Mycobacteriales bacterium]